MTLLFYVYSFNHDVARGRTLTVGSELNPGDGIRSFNIIMFYKVEV